ncbi:MAG: nucleotidyltransferase family protein [Defluviitaleaceae bacterium]|nr:nucleotidyltransferase family protein [Defluviitaleaceae bacterium]
MGILGVIVEYNPLHNGHLHHLSLAKEITKAQFTIAVMSGNFLQRGLPACLGKFARTKLALEHGVDIVIELPALYATSAANYFATGAVGLLNALNVDWLVFGSETGELDALQNLADTKEDDDFAKDFKSNLKQGFSYSSAQIRTSKYSELALPNNILGIEYLRALKQSNSKIEPFVVQREQSYTSATEINKKLQNSKSVGSVESVDSIKKDVPKATFDIINDIIKESHVPTLNSYSQIFHYRLLQEKGKLHEFLDVTEGIENRILKMAREHFYLQDILDATKTKRYTKAKLQRIATHILLDIKKKDMETWPTAPYVRVLGLKKSAAHLLGRATLPIVTNVYKSYHPLLEKDIKAEEIYYLGTQKREIKHLFIVT